MEKDDLGVVELFGFCFVLSVCLHSPETSCSSWGYTVHLWTSFCQLLPSKRPTRTLEKLFFNRGNLWHGSDGMWLVHQDGCYSAPTRYSLQDPVTHFPSNWLCFPGRVHSWVLPQEFSSTHRNCFIQGQSTSKHMLIQRFKSLAPLPHFRTQIQCPLTAG